MTQTVLALSPHLDDAVFSAGAALAARARTGARVVVATLFTGGVAHPSGFALACQLDKGLDATVDYMALRRREDDAACAILGVADCLHAGLLEAPNRGYGSAAALFAPPHADDSSMKILTETVAALIARFQPQEIWAPRALGAHVDHVLLHRAVREMARGGAALWWWTDWPYVDRPHCPDPEGAALTQAVPREQPTDATSRALKAFACAAYQSQVRFQFGSEQAMRARIAASPFERFTVCDG